MNHRMVFSTVGKIVWFEAILLLLPYVVSLIYKEACSTAFLVAIIVAAVVGTLLTLIFKQKDDVIYSKEGFIIVTLSWVFLSLIGALPFRLSGEIPHYIDALFETVSGFTTTGASVLSDVECLSHGILFWRSFTHWIGGLGVLVFVMAVTSKNNDRSIHILRAEMPGPTVDKLVPRARDTAKILYVIYIVLTLVLAVLLLCGEMDLFESLVHAFGTAGTGGFGVKNSGLAGYSAYSQWVIAIFMFIFGINFNLFYLVILGKIKDVLKSGERWFYCAIVAIAISIISIDILEKCTGFAEAIRLSAFQVSSIISTTGFSTTDFNSWNSLSKGILFILMFIGGCAGSTAGGFKVSRVLLLGKSVRREFKRVLHPRTASVIKSNGKRVDESTVSGVMSYLTVYIACLVFIFLLISFEPFGLETNLSAVVACFNNIGPGFASVGPTANFGCYTIFTKIVLTLTMLLGRLEIYPILLTLLPRTWLRK